MRSDEGKIKVVIEKMREIQEVEKKSLSVITGKKADWGMIARECVGMANVRGGVLIVGIEDNANSPDAFQSIPSQLVEKTRKRIAALTINVTAEVLLQTAENGGQYIEIHVFPSNAIASMTDGRYYYRISDECRPLPPEELTRLFTDKPAFIWETKTIPSVSRDRCDQQKTAFLQKSVRESDRVSDFVKQKTLEELLDYYFMTRGECLTQLDVLWVGTRADRANLAHAPVVQFLKYDEAGDRVNKIVWDDYSMNPQELITDIWKRIPDWKEGIEVADGLFRKFIPNYSEEVIREILANAMVHHAYSIRGDIFINLYPDRLEIVSPGRLPVGVTPQNILHKSVRRNEHLAKVFYDLKLMEREGSGYDKIYEVLLSEGKQLPQVYENDDAVKVLVKRQIVKDEVISFLNRTNEHFQLRQREMICLGILAQHTTLTSIEFAEILQLPANIGIKDWLGRLEEVHIVLTRGQTKGTEYFVNPKILQDTHFEGKTTLKNIEPHRLRELIYQDISAYPQSSISEIHSRIGKEIKIRKIRSTIYEMVDESILTAEGERRWRRYSIDKKAPK